MSSRPECPDCGERSCIRVRCPAKPSPPPSTTRIVFLDFETTGLDPARGAEPIELAALVTDDAFRELGSFETLITPHTNWETWDPAALAMHANSGLSVLCRKRGKSRLLTGAKFNIFLNGFSADVLHLAGNSIHFDRGFLKHYWPEIEARFHHRMIDVSSLRMVAERMTSAEGLGGEKPHRAMADVRRSIAELHYWVEALRSGL